MIYKNGRIVSTVVIVGICSSNKKILSVFHNAYFKNKEDFSYVLSYCTAILNKPLGVDFQN